ncbi:hypothetical protein L6452_36062 [Arctium lappa]|uniref:Uncharacterized protein n=1 Tax=Arctium lappa TaxID=4217 RepID=A0ACB8Y8N6_ARCLA|nr:hypothetical protein L6452_36062 [Arctium lappa]
MMKKICTLELLSEKKVRSFQALRAEELTGLCESLRVSSGSVINFTETIVGMINNVICRATLGSNYKAQDQAVLIGLIKELLVTSGAFNVGEFFPRLKFLNVLLGIKSKWLKIHKDLDKILEEVLEDHKGRQGGGIERADEDLVDVLLRIKDGEELENPITFDNVKAVLLDMFAAGTDTSSATIVWAMAEMMRNPKVLKKAIEEFIPFGAGRRMCPGITFGTNSVESTLVELLYRFDWRLPDGLKPEDINMEECDGITTTLKEPLQIIPIALSSPMN